MGHGRVGIQKTTGDRMKSTRRGWLAAGAGGALFSRACLVDGAEPSLSPIEAEHAKIVTEFCGAWSTLDAEKIASFVADKVIYQVIDNVPLVRGKEGLIKFITPFLAKMQKAEWEILRTHAIGHLVINERIDHFYSKAGKDDAHFEVSGLFLVREGKIVEWKDYRMPKPASGP
jgi:limonene-1,2-epoxide hydrolase